MVYKGFTWNLSYGDVRMIKDLLENYVIETPEFVYRVDRRSAARLIHICAMIMEVSPDGTTPTHGVADA